MSRSSNLRAYALKYKLIQELGGKCEKCGYDEIENTAVFDFHHKNPLEKAFTINKAIEHGKSWEDIRAEAAKCSLLCANCHRLEHFSKPDIDIDEYFEKVRNRKQRPELENKKGRPTKAELVDLLRQHTKPEIAKSYGVSPNTITCWCHKFEIPPQKEQEQKKVLQKPDREQLIKLLEEYSAVQIGRLYGVSDKAVKKWMIKFGIENPRGKKFYRGAKIDW